MKSFDETSFLEELLSLWSMPIIFAIVGHPKRQDFLYVSNETTGIPLLYRWIGNGEKQLLTKEPISRIIALHSTKPLVAFAKGIGGTEDYAIYLLDYSENGDLKQITKGTIGNVVQIFWINDENLLVVGFNMQNYYVKTLAFDGQMVDVFTTDKQILNANYDSKRNLLVAAVGRSNTKLAIIDVKEAKVKEWISEGENSACNFPATSEKGYLAYATDQPKTHDEIIIRSIENLEEQSRIVVPGFVGFWPFDQDAIQWVNKNILLVAVGKNAQVSPYLLNTGTGNWSEPLSEGSLSQAIITSEGPVWASSTFTQPQAIQMMKNGNITKLFEMKGSIKDITFENHWYNSFDGQKIQGWLAKNPDPKAPLLIYCHGGPTEVVANRWDPLFVTFVFAGFHIFAPNF